MRASIISPVSRHLMVNDIQRSVDFYVNLLGFENTSADIFEVRSGPARISLHSAVGLRKDSQLFSPAGKAILFFEVDDVNMMYEYLIAKDVSCSAPEKVNWIKIEMFATTDPDGHQLWFGRSYHHEFEAMHSGVIEGQFRTIMPTFTCKNVPAAVQHYVAVLGFSVNYEQHDFAVLDRDKVRILLMQGNEKRAGSGQCYIYVQNADEVYRELIAKGADVKGQPLSQPWGLREFQVTDADGNDICLGQTFE